MIPPCRIHVPPKLDDLARVKKTTIPPCGIHVPPKLDDLAHVKKSTIPPCGIHVPPKLDDSGQDYRKLRFHCVELMFH